MYMYVSLLSDLGRRSELQHFATRLLHQMYRNYIGLKMFGNAHEQCFKITLSQVFVLTEHVQCVVPCNVDL